MNLLCRNYCFFIITLIAILISSILPGWCQAEDTRITPFNEAVQMRLRQGKEKVKMQTRVEPEVIQATPVIEKVQQEDPDVLVQFDNIARLKEILLESKTGEKFTPELEAMLEMALKDLSVSKAVQIALVLNPQLLNAESQVKESVGVYNEAKSNMNFKLNTNATYARIDPVAVAEFQFNPNEPPAEIELGKHNNWSGKLILEKVISTFGQLENSIAAAKLRMLSQQQRREGVVQDVILSVRESYFQLLKAQGLVRIAEENKVIVERQLKITRDMFDAGVVPNFDVLRSELLLSRAEQGVITAKNFRDISRAALLNQLGLARDYPMNLNDEFVIQPLDIDILQAQEVALQNRPEIKAAILAVDALKHTVKAARSGKAPTLAFSSTYENKTTAGLSAVPNTFTQALVLSFPIFDGGLTHARVQQAEAALTQVESSLAQLYLGLRLEVKQSVLTLKELSAKLEAAEKDVVTAQEGYDIGMLRYENGLSTSVELDDSLRLLNEAKINYLNVQYDYLTSLARLEKATGTIWKGETE
ncbi:MAG: TolC family protein [Vulcanimicrobiota bacterium]